MMKKHSRKIYAFPSSHKIFLLFLFLSGFRTSKIVLVEFVDYISFNMIRILLRQQSNTLNFLQHRTLANLFKKNESHQKIKFENVKKPYEVLLHSSLELIPKIPTPYLLKHTKARNLARIMSTNHGLDH